MKKSLPIGISHAILELRNITSRFESYKKFEKVVDIIIAQWLHESGFGTSQLADKYNNFGGMQFRSVHAPYGEAVEYVDWSGQAGDYLSLRDPRLFALAYFDFIGRSIYSGLDEVLENGQPSDFITFLATCGYVGSTPGVTVEKYPNADERKKAKIQHYSSQICKLAVEYNLQYTVNEAGYRAFPYALYNPATGHLVVESREIGRWGK